jgi:hypothetical protein
MTLLGRNIFRVKRLF